jgi:nucleotide-binding universal stress UspA family protein
MKKILIGVGDSKFADHAAGYGFDLAHKLKAEVGLIHIIEPIITTPVATTDSTIGMPFDENMDMMLPELYQIQDEQARSVIAGTIKKYGHGIQITNFTEFGSTADGILKCSDEFKADIIVLGTHSRTGIDRFLMGSVAEEVVRHAQVPVLVVPMPHED